MPHVEAARLLSARLSGKVGHTQEENRILLTRPIEKTSEEFDRLVEVARSCAKKISAKGIGVYPRPMTRKSLVTGVFFQKRGPRS